MITIYTLALNEELMIQFIIDHYRARFPNCQIVVNANKNSTDNTIKIAKANNCEVVLDDNKGLRDEPLTQIKNNCWKSAKTDWVLVCDMDELLDINETQLKKEMELGTTIVRSRAYDMVDMEDKLDIKNMKYGARATAQDKFYLFNKKYIKEINYNPGAHISIPEGVVKLSKKIYPCYHYCYVNYKKTVEKYKMLRSRMTEKDIRDNIPFYKETPEEIRLLYKNARKKAVKVR